MRILVAFCLALIVIPAWAAMLVSSVPVTTPSYFGMHIWSPLSTPTNLVSYGSRRMWSDGTRTTSGTLGAQDIVYDPSDITWAFIQPTAPTDGNWTFFDADVSAQDGHDITYTMLGEDSSNTSQQILISSGTYNNSTGVVSLTLSSSVTFASGASITVAALTGTGAFASIAGTYVTTGASSTNVTFNAGASLGASTITGGAIAQRGAPTQPGWAFVTGTTGQMDLTKLGVWTATLLARFHSDAPHSRIYLEVRNEPDGSFSSNGGTGAQVTAELQAVFNATQTFNSSNGTTYKVLLPPISNGSTSSVAFLNSMFVAGACAYADILTHHSYSSSGVDITTLVALLNSIDASFSQYCPGKPRWSTEWGMSGSGVPNINDRAANTVKYVLVHRVYGRDREFEFGLDFYTNTYYPSFGLLLTDAPPSTTLSVVGTAYQQAYSWLNGNWITNGASVTSTLCTIPISGPSGFKGLVVWHEDRTTANYTVPAGMNFYTTIDGTKTATTPGASVSTNYSPTFFSSSWLLERDIKPANDNVPMFSERVA